MGRSSDKDVSLFLCRTPLQAKICSEIIKKNNIKHFDFVYFTQNNSESDRCYYESLREHSRNSLYLHVEKKKPDILNHLVSIFRFYRGWAWSGYKSLYLASIDSFLFRYIVKKSDGARLFGFDDGAANLSRFGHYYNYDLYKKANFYSKVLGLPTTKNVRDRIAKHYSIYEGLGNIVPDEDIIFLDVFDFGSRNFCKSMGMVTFFIGQPFFEYLESDEVDKLRRWVDDQEVDFYIKHPREEYPLVSNVKMLSSNGLLAEDLIAKTSGGRFPKVIAGYSSVLFNLPRENVEKVYISVKKDENENERVNLIKKAGCFVVIV